MVQAYSTSKITYIILALYKIKYVLKTYIVIGVYYHLIFLLFLLHHQRSVIIILGKYASFNKPMSMRISRNEWDAFEYCNSHEEVQAWCDIISFSILYSFSLHSTYIFVYVSIVCLTTICAMPFGQITARQTNCLPEGYRVWLTQYIPRIMHTVPAYVCVK